MAIPEHVKRQAMDAVANKETTAQIRLYSSQEVDASHRDLFSNPQRGPESKEIPDHVKKLAMDAVANKETTAQIRLVKDTGSVVAQSGPARESNRVAERIALMQKDSQNVDSVHRSVTKDSFERHDD